MVGEVRKDVRKNNVLFYFALALLIVSLVVFFMNISKVVKITGKSVGDINITIETLTQLNFTTSNINWGSGCVSPGKTSAIINTSSNGVDNVTNGNWTGNSAGLVIENIGNKNVTLDLAAGLTAATLIGGTSPDYEWNFSDGAEEGSCTVSSPVTLGVFWDVNDSARICDVFNYDNSLDVLRIDIKLIIPADSTTGAIGDVITATATAI